MYQATWYHTGQNFQSQQACLLTTAIWKCTNRTTIIARRMSTAENTCKTSFSMLKLKLSLATKLSPSIYTYIYIIYILPTIYTIRSSTHSNCQYKVINLLFFMHIWCTKLGFFSQLNHMKIFSEIFHHPPVSCILTEFSISKEQMCASSCSEIQRTDKRLAPA